MSYPYVAQVLISGEKAKLKIIHIPCNSQSVSVKTLHGRQNPRIFASVLSLLTSGQVTA